MTHLLDTNICSAHIKRPAGLAHRFFQHAGGLAVPTIVMAELYTGAHKHAKSSRLLTGIADLLQEVTILDFDLACAEKFGEVNGDLLRTGITVPPLDLLIASVALVHDLTLVTHNTADYRNIPNFRLDDWLVP
jgi:tRNA(fMet)-specific endonuclease VapC